MSDLDMPVSNWSQTWIASSNPTKEAQALEFDLDNGLKRMMNFTLISDSGSDKDSAGSDDGAEVYLDSLLMKDEELLSSCCYAATEAAIDGMTVVFSADEDSGVCVVISEADGEDEAILGMCGHDMDITDPDFTHSVVEFLENFEGCQPVERLIAYLNKTSGTGAPGKSVVVDTKKMN